MEKEEPWPIPPTIQLPRLVAEAFAQEECERRTCSGGGEPVLSGRKLDGPGIIGTQREVKKESRSPVGIVVVGRRGAHPITPRRPLVWVRAAHQCNAAMSTIAVRVKRIQAVYGTMREIEKLEGLAPWIQFRRARPRRLAALALRYR